MSIFDYLNKTEIDQLVGILNSNIELIEESSVNDMVSSYVSDYSLIEREYSDYLELDCNRITIKIKEFCVEDSDILMKYDFESDPEIEKGYKKADERRLNWRCCSEQTYERIKKYLSCLDSPFTTTYQFNVESLIRTITRRVVDQTLKY